jgi:hypothetical protein
MKHSFLCLIVFTAITVTVSCNNEPEKTGEPTPITDTAKPGENKVMVPVSDCYSFIKHKDTVLLKMDKFPNVVTGILSYHFHEKDSNNGDIDGALHGDTLIADYKFMSEGKPSVRQVAFLLQENSATEGYGPQEEKEGKMVFKNLNEIDFKMGIKLKKIQCAVQ